MIRTNAARARYLANADSSALADASSPDAERAEARAKRIVNTVATLRILVPVALITAIVVSGRLPEARIDNALATIAETSAVTNAAAQNYYPAQFVNQGQGGEESIPTF